MCSVTMEYSEERGTWNVFVDYEWYYEGDFEHCCEIVNSFSTED